MFFIKLVTMFDLLSDCGDLRIIPNGNLTLVSESNTTYGAVADVTCDTGYTPSEPDVRCLENATWSSADCSAGKLSPSYNFVINKICCQNIVKHNLN